MCRRNDPRGGRDAPCAVCVGGGTVIEGGGGDLRAEPVPTRQTLPIGLKKEELQEVRSFLLLPLRGQFVSSSF